MRHRWLVIVGLAVWMAVAPSASAQKQGLIVRDTWGAVHLNALCPIMGCEVVSSLGDPQQQVFLVVPNQIAPGENIVSTFPYDTYSSSSGTSFSAPLVSGTAALLLSVNQNANQSTAAAAIAHAQHISPDLNNGRLDTYQAVGSLSP